MTEDDIKASIKAEEGLRLNVYRDSLGNLTVGYGHLLRPGTSISQDVADLLFENDYKRAAYDFGTFGLENLDDVRRAAIIDMIFNMGSGGVCSFHSMIRYLKKGNWVKAADELMKSEYAKQVPERAKRNRDRILEGVPS